MGQHFWKTSCALLMMFSLAAIASPAQTLTTLATFTGFNGSDPYYGRVIQGADGNFYGTTAYGGANCQPSGCGIVFKIAPQGTLTTLYSFCSQPNCSDGLYPYAGLIQGADGNFYGTTTEGGDNGHAGTVFKITPAGVLTTLASFCTQTNCIDGDYPTGPLVQGSDGNFYGTTFSGGLGDAQYCNGGCGTVFKITSTGTRTVLHDFTGFNLEGSGPNSGLVQGNDGNFYGTTSYGGAFSACTLACGTVFKITPKGTLTTLHSFAGYPSDGQEPYGNLVLGNNGAFYGTTSAGGTGNNGSVFKITPSGTLTVLYNFCTQANCYDGGDPEAGLVLAADGNFYGTAVRGGVYGIGSIFETTPQGVLTTLYSFCSQGYPGCPDGDLLYGGLTQGTNGKLYGNASQGGDSSCGSGYGCGTLFSFDTGLGPFVTFLRPSARVGQSFDILGQGFRGTTSVLLNGAACAFSVKSNTLIVATVPAGATSGYVIVNTLTGTLKSNMPFRVIP